MRRGIRHGVNHRPAQTRHYLWMAKQRGLLVTGGSDSHGPGGTVSAIAPELSYLFNPRQNLLQNPPNLGFF